jgi:serine phosphatase RsbU (regulator of sigma subunit)
MAEAFVASVEGRWDAAISAIQAVAERWGRMGQEWSRGRALQEWAEVHISRGELADLERAEQLLREARQVFQQTGATYYAARCEERLRAVRARIFSRALALGAVSLELATAKRIQEGLLPQEPPQLAGWELAACLEPAKETSGDFYDFIPLPNGRWGLVIADVADKGAGAALYMALSCTLIRACAEHHPEHPELTLDEVNRRILADTHTDLFVTVFYGILAPEDGRLTYCNAGQHPPYLFRGRGRGGVDMLERTGPPLGILEEAAWEPQVVQLLPGDVLLLYTDGVTDAQGADGIPYSRGRLLRVAQSSLEGPATAVQGAVLDDVHAFVGGAPQFDDVALMVVARLEPGAPS